MQHFFLNLNFSFPYPKIISILRNILNLVASKNYTKFNFEQWHTQALTFFLVMRSL